MASVTQTSLTAFQANFSMSVPALTLKVSACPTQAPLAFALPATAGVDQSVCYSSGEQG